MGLLLLFSLITSFLISYSLIKKGVVDAKGEMFARISNDVLGFVEIQDARVHKGEISLEQAQEEVREFVNGPKLSDGSRDAAKSRMNLKYSGKEKDPYMYVWSINSKGKIVLHPFSLENAEAWDLTVEGRYTVRDSYGNPDKVNILFRELWQNPGEPVYTFLAYQVYYEPWDWIIGTGAREEILYADLRNQLLKKFFIGSFILMIVASVIGFFTTKMTTNSILQVKDMMKDISEGEGDLTTRLNIKTNDEVGELAGWFDKFMENLQGIIHQSIQNTRSVDDSSRELLSIAGSLSQGAEDASELSTNASSASEQMSSNIAAVAAVMEEASTNITMVATASEEMNATINEITKNTDRARHISEDAVKQAGTTSEQMEALKQSAIEISKVTETIHEISEQTNLLALNATIEAARAGEAGKGFAVVANEIKDLAGQTAQATQDIKFKVDNIQNTTNSSVDGIGAITGVVEDIHQIISTIATAVEEQSATTSEIAVNIAQVANGVQDANKNVNESSNASQSVAEDIAQLNEAAGSVANNAGKVNDQSENLRQRAEELQMILSKFKVQ